MSLPINIQSGDGNGQTAHVEDGALHVEVHPFPPIHPSRTRIFRQYLTTNGLPGGTNDMQIGAATTALYYIPASSDADRYITNLSFAIADASPALNQFGAIAALTNGCRLYYEKTNERVYIHDALKTNWDFIRLCLGQPAFGTGTAAYIASNVSGASEGIIPVLNLSQLMPPYGIKLDKGTSERLVLEVRDQTDGVDEFNCIAYGFERFE